MNNNKNIPNYFQLEAKETIEERHLPNPDKINKQNLIKHLWINILGGNDDENFRVQFGFGNYIIEHQYENNEKHRKLFKKIKSYLYETELSVGLNNRNTITKSIVISYLNINIEDLYKEMYRLHKDIIKFENENK